MSEPTASGPAAPPDPEAEPAPALPTSAQLDGLEADLDRVDDVLARLDEEG